MRRCTAARVAARPRAIDLATVVDRSDVNVDRGWRTDATMMNGDRRVPFLWITTVRGFKYECCSALPTDYNDYSPFLAIDHRYMRDTSSLYLD